ncbi:transposase, IS1478 family [Tannerella forsythia 3313]|nr:transposase, IS1478 family [Tannerella forsythia 3313]
MLNQSHPLYKLTDKIDWEKFDTAFFSIPPVIMPEEKLG